MHKRNGSYKWSDEEIRNLYEYVKSVEEKNCKVNWVKCAIFVSAKCGNPKTANGCKTFYERDNLRKALHTLNDHNYAIPVDTESTDNGTIPVGRSCNEYTDPGAIHVEWSCNESTAHGVITVERSCNESTDHGVIPVEKRCNESTDPGAIHVERRCNESTDPGHCPGAIPVESCDTESTDPLARCSIWSLMKAGWDRKSPGLKSSMGDGRDRISPGLKVEVLNIDCIKNTVCYWIATVIKLSGLYRAVLRYEGFEPHDTSHDIWLNLRLQDVHPVGWCTANDKPLVPPLTIQTKCVDWNDFLVQRLTNARTLPKDFYRIRQQSGFEWKDIKAEMVDPKCVSAIRVSKIYVTEENTTHLEHNYSLTQKDDDVESFKRNDNRFTEDRSLLCSLCGKEYSFRNSLLKHQRLHKGYNILCNVCGKLFREKFDLTIHMRSHTNENPYPCNICKKAFRKLSSLKYHLLTHTGEKPYECKFCKKKFRRAHHLTVHTRIHTGEKPFSCSICGKRFVEKTTLKKHIHIHTGKIQECKTCGKNVRSSSWYNHQRTHKKSKHSQPVKSDTMATDVLNEPEESATGNEVVKTQNECARVTDVTSNPNGCSSEYPYACNYCPKYFIRSEELQTHHDDSHKK